jgi:site-specific recombinase XerD
MLSALRSYLRFLIDSDQQNIPIPPDAIKMVKTERKESQVAELDELIKLIESPEIYEKKENIKFRNRAILELLFSSGMRISELINLNRDDLKISQNEEIDESKIYILGKGKKQRFVYLTPRAKSFLERYLHTRKDDYQALFIPYRGLRSGTKDTYQVRLSNNYVQAKIKQYRKLVGIVVPTSAHSLRHGFATYLAEKGASPVAIQRLLGHESLQTTSKYMHSSDKYAEQVHNKYHPLKNVESAPDIGLIDENTE